MTATVWWTWTAKIKPNGEAGFRSLVERWDANCAAHDGTVFSEWTIGEDNSSVRVDLGFVDAAAAMAQFGANPCWSELDDHVVPASMHILGAFDQALDDALRSHGAVFWRPIDRAVVP